MQKLALQKAIRKVQQKKKNVVLYPLRDDDIEDVIYNISYKYKLPFNVYSRTSNDGLKWWLQCEYYSEKIQKTIIWHYNWYTYFEDENELVEKILKTAKEIEEFEARLSIEKEKEV